MIYPYYHGPWHRWILSLLLLTVVRRSSSFTRLSLSSDQNHRRHGQLFPTVRLGLGSKLCATNHLETTSSTPSGDGVLTSSPLLGDVYRIRLEGEDSDFLAANAVPTYAATGGGSVATEEWKTTESKATPAPRGLEGVLGQGPAFVLDNVLSPTICNELIETLESIQQGGGFGNYHAGKNHHGALQVIVPQSVTDAIGSKLSRAIDLEQVQARRTELLQATNTNQNGPDDEHTSDIRLVYAGLNQRWRVYRYAPGGNEQFAPHIDAGFPPSSLSEDGSQLIWDDTASYIDEKAEDDGSSSVGPVTTEMVSRLTLLIYLNDDFVGGETKFFEPLASRYHQSDDNDDVSRSVIASVKPVTGSCLVFPQGVGEDGVDYARQHWPLHEGSPVLTGSTRPKYVVRSDILFATTKESLILDNPLWKNDHLVRQTFLPKASSSVVDRNFLSQLESLYNPHMGVENLASFLYSLIRFTKKRRIVEIGAGYTTLWILKALRDNDEEMKDIERLRQEGNCKLLDIEWTVEEEMTRIHQESPAASLLCIDNCEHQKETATGACAVAKSLGLDSYLEFVKGDAFEMGDFLEESSVDLLWCDFGVGTRMSEFMSQGAWASLRPGGLLLCHSTLTNQRTRNWLEAARGHAGEAITGIPAGEYTELSFLEPFKRYQNSVSIFQKRGATTEPYAEPIFSEYA